MSETVNKGSSKGKGSVGSAGHPLSLRRADVAEGAAGEGGGPGAVWAQHGGWARGDRAKGEGRVATAAHCPLPGRVQDVPYPALTSVQRQASPGMTGPVLCLPHSVRPCGREDAEKAKDGAFGAHEAQSPWCGTALPHWHFRGRQPQQGKGTEATRALPVVPRGAPCGWGLGGWALRGSASRGARGVGRATLRPDRVPKRAPESRFWGALLPRSQEQRRTEWSCPTPRGPCGHRKSKK